MTARAILYIGALSGTSLQRAKALNRLGHEVRHISPYVGLPQYWSTWLNRAGGPGLDTLVASALRRQIDNGVYDLAIVDCGDVIGSKALGVLRAAAPVVGNYNADNPYRNPPAERRRWTLLRRALTQYDLSVTVRRDGLDAQMRRLGSKSPMLIWQCADEVTHRPRHLTPDDENKWSSEVAFVGSWMPGRGAFIGGLIDKRVPVALYGPRWEKAPEYSRLAPHIRSSYLEGHDYCMAIAGAKVALVMLNGANDDLHTTRSAEIPAIGTAMCAPRTAHHLELYAEGKEAVFFGDIDECAVQCKRLLADDALRTSIAAAGHRRTFLNGTYNETLMGRIVDELVRIRDASAGKAA